MKRQLILLLLLLGLSTVASARDSARGWCEEGGRKVVTSGLQSTTLVQSSHPSCTITIYVHGGGLATIFSDNNNTPLANPFTSQSDGQWQFYADNGRYDATMASAGFSQTITYSDILLCDPFVMGSTCNNGGATQAHNLLSTTHLDTIPASPPVRGDIITAQNQTSPTGVNPSWARLPLGSNNFVLTSNGVDAIWAPVASGAGCTLPGLTDTAVVSEHPVTVCYDSANWTWNDGASKQNMQAGLSNVVGTASVLTFTEGQSNTLCDLGTVAACSNLHVQGTSNDVEDVAAFANAGDVFKFNWIQGRLNQMAGNIQDSYIIGGDSTSLGSNAFDTNTTGTIRNVVCLAQGCSRSGGGINAVNGGSVIIGLFAGSANTINANGASALSGELYAVGAFSSYSVSDTSTLTSIFTYGESDTVGASNNCTQTDFYHLGHFNTGTCSGSGGHLIDSYSVGRGSSFITNNSATNSINTAIGANFTLTNCSHHHMFGEAGTCSGSATATATVGVSATPEIVVTAGSVKYNAPITMDPNYIRFINTTVAGLNTCNSGLKGAIDAVSDSSVTTSGSIVVGGGSSSVEVYCNGTNWLVSGGGSAGGAITSINSATGPAVTIQGVGATTVSTSGNTVSISGGTTGNISGTWVNIANNYTVQDTDNVNRLRFTTAAAAITLPQPSTITTNPFVAMRAQVNMGAGGSPFTSSSFATTAGHQMWITVQANGTTTVSSVTMSTGDTCTQQSSTTGANAAYVYFCPNLIGGGSVTITATYTAGTASQIGLFAVELVGTTFDNAQTGISPSGFSNISLTNPIHFTNAVAIINQQNADNIPPAGFVEKDSLGNTNTGTASIRLLSNSNSLSTTSINGISFSQTIASISNHPAFVAGWQVVMENVSTGIQTVTSTSSTINGQTTLVMAPNEICNFLSNGSNWDAVCGFIPNVQTNGVMGGVVEVAGVNTSAAGADQSITTLVTTGAVDAFYEVKGSIACHGVTSTGTSTLTITYTDTSNTVQTLSSAAAACTTLGSASVSQVNPIFRAKASTNIRYAFAHGGTQPTVDVSVGVYQLSTQ